MAHEVDTSSQDSQHALGHAIDDLSVASGSRSATPNSSSTYEFSHEPFETFKDKVVALATDLKACSIEDIRRLKGGSYNRTIAARVNWPLTRPLEVVFRIPRFPEKDSTNDDIQTQAAVLGLVRQHGISAPRLLAFDASNTNAIASPYVVQSLAEGTGLELVYDTMSLAQKMDIAGQLVELLRAMEEVEFPQSGRLRCDATISQLQTWCWANRPDCERESWNLVVRDVRKPHCRPGPEPLAGMSALSYIAALFEFEQQQLAAESANGIDMTFDHECVSRVQELCTQMQTCDWSRYDHTRNVLHHWDLEPRNIVVRTEGDGEECRWKITAVLDWDDALSVPSVLTRRPPCWLWDSSEPSAADSEEIAGDDDPDSLPPEHYAGLTGDEAQIKKHFESCFLNRVMRLHGTTSMHDYIDEAYGSGRWIRRLWRFAQHGFHDTQDLTRLDKLEEDWSQYYTAATV